MINFFSLACLLFVVNLGCHSRFKFQLSLKRPFTVRYRLALVGNEALAFAHV